MSFDPVVARRDLNVKYKFFKSLAEYMQHFIELLKANQPKKETAEMRIKILRSLRLMLKFESDLKREEDVNKRLYLSEAQQRQIEDLSMMIRDIEQINDKLSIESDLANRARDFVFSVKEELRTLKKLPHKPENLAA